MLPSTDCFLTFTAHPPTLLLPQAAQILTPLHMLLLSAALPCTTPVSPCDLHIFFLLSHLLDQATLSHLVVPLSLSSPPRPSLSSS